MFRMNKQLLRMLSVNKSVNDGLYYHCRQKMEGNSFFLDGRKLNLLISIQS